ncbi:MAG TPA: M23 family metallopeptidase [Acidimicrobiia bacterium]|nr:M23 family metallopeptidase [Acidimicrobiia bacterium]
MRSRLAFVALLVVSICVTPALAFAQTTQPGLEGQIAQLTQQGEAALQQLQGVQQQEAVLNARAAQLQSQLDAAQARLNPLADKAAALDAEVAQLQAIVDAEQAQLAQAQAAFDQSAAQMYRAARVGASYEELLTAGPGDLLAESKYLSLVTQQRRDLVDRVTSLRDEVERQRESMLGAQAQADAAANAARAARDQVASLQAQLVPAQQQAAAQAATVQASLTQIQGNLSEDQAELASIAGPSDGISQMLRDRDGVGGSARECAFRPVPGGVNQPFIPGQHPGIDLHASYGDPIRACLGGVVVIAGWEGGYGNATVIDDGGGMANLYGHQSQLAVSVGQTVTAGQVIGYIGSTGYSTGPHLHFEVRVSGNPVDPAPYLPPPG